VEGAEVVAEKEFEESEGAQELTDEMLAFCKGLNAERMDLSGVEGVMVLTVGMGDRGEESESSIFQTIRWSGLNPGAAFLL
jgi:hypothetical protein